MALSSILLLGFQIFHMPVQDSVGHHTVWVSTKLSVYTLWREYPRSAQGPNGSIALVGMVAASDSLRCDKPNEGG